MEELTAPADPNDPVKRAVYERINADRLAAGVPRVAWDESAGRVADAFCAQQVRERSHGHFLMDGLPPYARTGFAGVFGMQSENSVSWTTTGTSFRDTVVEKLALGGHRQMMEERPPNDGHRRTILDPEATHVGVGYFHEGGRFQMAQEFLTRRLERLSLTRPRPAAQAVRIRGKALPAWRLEYVTIAVEPPPRPLTREQASGRRNYSYPEPVYAYVPEGHTRVRVVGVITSPRIARRRDREFSFTVPLDEPGLWTIVFYAARSGNPPQAGGSAVIWVEERRG